MKYQSILATCTAFAAGQLLSSHAAAAVSFSLSDGIGDPNSVSVAPGDFFTFKLEITSTAELLTGLSYNLETFGLSSGQFRITARTLGATPFTDLISADSIALQASSALLNPINDADLGGLLADVFSPVGPGTQLVANYTIQALPTITAPGTYSIGVANGVASDDQFADLPVTSALYNIQVVPEPGTALFGLFCLGSMGARRFRFRRNTQALA